MYSDNNLFGLGLERLVTGCPGETTLSVNDQLDNIYVNAGTITIFKVCGAPNADFIVQDVGIVNGGIGGGISNFYPYDVIDRGQLDSDGNYVFTIPLNKVGTYVFRVGIWCTVADIDYCSQVSNTVKVTVLDVGCASNYVCRQPLDGYEYDANDCGREDRLNSVCNSPIDGDNNDNHIYNLLKVGVVIAAVGIVVNYYVTKENKG